MQTNRIGIKHSILWKVLRIKIKKYYVLIFLIYFTVKNNLNNFNGILLLVKFPVIYQYNRLQRTNKISKLHLRRENTRYLKLIVEV